MSVPSHSSRRGMFVVGIIGSIVVIALMAGVILVQTGSNVNEVSISSSSTSLSSETSSQSRSAGTNSGTTSESSSTTSSSSTSTYTGPTGILGVSLTDPPIVPPGVTDVYISYSSIQVHVADAGNQDGWYLVAESGSVDLMSLLNVSLTLGSAAVQTGVFNLISFNITSAAVTINGQNATAYVPANRINVPIVGGISVTTGNSSGVLVDLSPEVVPYQNGTSVSYVLVPEARSLPIPKDIWNYRLEVKGAKLDEIQNQTWVSKSAGQVVVSGVHLTPNSFSLTLQNQGTTNASFSSIVLGQVLPLPQCLATPTAGSPRPTVKNSSSVSVSVYGASFSGAESVYIGGRVYPPPSVTNASASILVTDPNGVVVESLVSSVELSGEFHTTFVAGGSNLPWIGGVYTVSAMYNGTAGNATFNWTPETTTTTSIEYTNSTTSSTEYTYNATTTEYSNSTYTTRSNITVLTNGTSYFGQSGVFIYGGISPAPSTPNLWVSIRVLSPNHVVVFSTDALVSPNGQFNASFTIGMPSTDSSDRYLWTNGTYLVYAYRDGLVSSTKFQWSGPGPVVTTYTETSETVNTTVSSNGGFQKYFCGLYSAQDRANLPPSFTVAYYAIFSNGTLYPINYTSLMLNVIHHYTSDNHDGNTSTSSRVSGTPLTYTLAPGQSVTFTFNGTIDSLNGALLSYLPANFAVPSSLFHIDLGQEYTVSADGPFETGIATIVNATAT